MNTKSVKPWMWRLAVVAGLSLLVTVPLLQKEAKKRTDIEILAAEVREESPVNISLAGRQFLFPRKYIFLPATDEERSPRDAAGRIVHSEGRPKALREFGFYLTYPSFQFLHWSRRSQVPVSRRLLVALKSIPSMSESKNVLTYRLNQELEYLNQRYTRSSQDRLQVISPVTLKSEDIYYQETAGEVTTWITCSRAQIPERSMCKHLAYLSPKSYGVRVEISYPKLLLQDWSYIETQVVDAVRRFEVN